MKVRFCWKCFSIIIKLLSNSGKVMSFMFCSKYQNLMFFNQLNAVLVLYFALYTVVNFVFFYQECTSKKSFQIMNSRKNDIN